MKKTYIAILDTIDLQGRFWLSDSTRKLTDEQASPFLAKKKIKLFEGHKPKRYVVITDTVAGTEERMPWGEYLKYRYSLKRKK